MAPKDRRAGPARYAREHSMEVKGRGHMGEYEPKLGRCTRLKLFYFFFSTITVPLSLRAPSITLPAPSRLNSIMTPL